MSRIETGCDNHWASDDRPELPHLPEGAPIDKLVSFLNTPDWRWRALAKKLRLGALVDAMVTTSIFRSSPDLADHRCAAPGFAQPSPHQKLWPSCSAPISASAMASLSDSGKEQHRPWPESSGFALPLSRIRCTPWGDRLMLPPVGGDVDPFGSRIFQRREDDRSGLGESVLLAPSGSQGGMRADFSRNTPASNRQTQWCGDLATDASGPPVASPSAVCRKAGTAAFLRPRPWSSGPPTGDCGSAGAPANRLVGPFSFQQAFFDGVFPPLKPLTSCNRRTASSSFHGRARVDRRANRVTVKQSRCECRGMGSSSSAGGQCGSGSRQESCKTGSRADVKQQAAEARAAHAHSTPGCHRYIERHLNKAFQTPPPPSRCAGSPPRGGMTSAVIAKRPSASACCSKLQRNGEFRRSHSCWHSGRALWLL